MRKIRVLVVCGIRADSGSDLMIELYNSGFDVHHLTYCEEIELKREMLLPDVMIIADWWVEGGTIFDVISAFDGLIPIIFLDWHGGEAQEQVKQEMSSTTIFMNWNNTADDITNLIGDINKLTASLRADLEWLDLNPTK